jgi:hypothetical protein
VRGGLVEDSRIILRFWFTRPSDFCFLRPAWLRFDSKFMPINVQSNFNVPVQSPPEASLGIHLTSRSILQRVALR